MADLGASTRRPDPSTKMLRSSFGKQTKSTAASQPSFGFGTSVREAGLKVCGVMRGEVVPGRLRGWRRRGLHLVGRGGRQWLHRRACGGLAAAS